MAEYKNALEYIKSDKFSKFHKERKEKQKDNQAKHKALSDHTSKQYYEKHKGPDSGRKESYHKFLKNPSK